MSKPKLTSDDNRIQKILEKNVKKDRFSGAETYSEIKPILEKKYNQHISKISTKLDPSTIDQVLVSLIRNVFLIELVNDEISSTKMEVRWIEKKSSGKKQEKFDKADPRFCSFDECLLIFEGLLEKLSDSIDNEKARILNRYIKFGLLSYEIPVDYKKVPQRRSTEKIHFHGNIDWFWDDKYQKTLELRETLLSETKTKDLFVVLLKDKLKVKTYLTDRVQTGTHKTNREKRWEVHPESVHFALRKECLLVERKLISQICYFEGFPKDYFDIVKDKIIPEVVVYRCPVTLDPLSFAKFKGEIENPNHGKSSFAVGHLNPLKSDTSDRAFGHTSENIGWISDDGNRIQGSLSLKETRKLLARINQNYTKTGNRDKIST